MNTQTHKRAILLIILKSTSLIRLFLLLVIPMFMIAFPVLSSGSEKMAFHESELQNCLLPHTDEIQFEEEVVYSEPAEFMFGNISTAAVDHSGRVLMGDNNQKMIHVFSPDGDYLESFGRQGNGPGEFQMISKIAVDDNYIHVFDMIMGHINIFDAQKAVFIRTVVLIENGGMIQRGAAENDGLGRPFDMHLLTDGNYLVSFRSMRTLHRPQTAIISPQGDVIQKNRFELRTGTNEVVENSSGNRRVFATFPFSRVTKITLSPNGLLFSNWSESLEFDLFDESGNKLRSISYPWQNARMNRQELINMYENVQPQGVAMGAGTGGQAGGGGMSRFQEMLRDIDLPETWPAVDRIYADSQNRLWVSSFTRNAEERKWLLFDETGGFLGTFTWPASRQVIHADQNIVYVLDRPVDDFDTVIRYRFMR